jgi:nucleoside-diphosphate-sugar epimerase
MTGRVLIAGATGVVGRALVPLLRDRGYQVAALVRDPARVSGFELDEVFVADALDAPAVREAVLAAKPDVVLHQLSALRQAGADGLEQTAKLRTEGTRALIDAARAAGVGRFVAQSIAFCTAPTGEPVLTEKAPLYLDAPDPGWARTVHAVAEHERLVLETPDLIGTVLRYGTLYGPGTLYHPTTGQVGSAVARGRLPLPESAEGVTSFLHIEDAARAAAAAIETGADGVFNVTDDEPATAADWVTTYARLLGAPAPRTVPAQMLERMLGWPTVYQFTAMRGASNEQARRALGWEPWVPNWRTRLAAD